MVGLEILGELGFFEELVVTGEVDKDDFWVLAARFIKLEVV